MADISNEINNFRSAIYGEEVRGSMITLAEKLNTEMVNTTNTVTQTVVEVNDAIDDCEDATEDATSIYNILVELRGTLNTEEASRVAAESGRVSAELARVSEELTRSNAEVIRESNELIRIENERQRQSYENDRRVNENSRISAENSRVSAESTRVNNETARNNAETTRSRNETSRELYEQNRQSAENLRYANEQTRIANELDRIDKFAQMSSQVIPVATRSTIGAVMVGDGLEVLQNGKLNVVGAGNLETATHAAATYATITALQTVIDGLVNYILFTNLNIYQFDIDSDTNEVSINSSLTWNQLANVSS